ncbi:MAG: Rrf2 family transcriptional regulator [Xanthobacteraceae bacterium]|nr:Rrf2 family transcriptional regulator [Xanthobacteraceae bacterium]QYK45080.1 MAG: Rrf2 family transcriptional regulator [Xanthobacteraceae bacterium]
MARLSEKSLLAVAAVVDVAIHSRGRPVAAKALAERHDLPPRHLEPMLQALVHAGILKGVRGPRGGYELARERRRISIAEIAQIAENAENNDRQRKPAVITNIIAPAIAKAERAFDAALGEITIESLCRNAEREGLAEGEASADFNI